MRSMMMRTGRSVGRTLYLQHGAEPDKTDELVGLMDTRALASQVSAAVNATTRLRSLHSPAHQAPRLVCAHCRGRDGEPVMWPCPTIAIVEGDDE